jgi:hypothetical protein
VSEERGRVAKRSSHPPKFLCTNDCCKCVKGNNWENDQDRILESGQKRRFISHTGEAGASRVRVAKTVSDAGRSAHGECTKKRACLLQQHNIIQSLPLSIKQVLGTMPLRTLSISYICPLHVCLKHPDNCANRAEQRREPRDESSSRVSPGVCSVSDSKLHSIHM